MALSGLDADGVASARVRALFVQWLAQPDTESVLSATPAHAPLTVHPPKSPMKSRAKQRKQPAPPPPMPDLPSPRPDENLIPCIFEKQTSPHVDTTTAELVEEMFRQHPEGLPLSSVEFLVRDHLKQSKFFSHTIFDRLRLGASSVSKSVLLRWLACVNVPRDPVCTFFHIVRSPDNDCIRTDDLTPFLTETITRHEGLAFLKATPDFQAMYIDAILINILYSLDPHDTYRITLPALRISCLVQAWKAIDDAPDLNNCKRFFSYEHFYVLYSHFWALDADRDSKLSRADLFRYNDNAFHAGFVDRLFDPSFHTFRSGTPGLMCFEDFVYLIRNDEDKTTDRALEFWFRVLDLDADGYIRAHEIAHFHEYQNDRLEALGHAMMSLEDTLCTLNDFLEPATPGAFTLADFKRRRQKSSDFFGSMVSLVHWYQEEKRDLYAVRAEKIEYPEDSDWDRFCRYAYIKKTTEEG